MIVFLNNCEDWDEQIINQGESLRRWGRRIVYTSDFGREEYVRCDTEAEAIKEFDERRFPDEYDAIVFESYRDGYSWQMEGVHSKEWVKTRTEAEYRLALEMVESGCFPDCWFVSDYGTHHNIAEDIRKYHDDGGDKMHPAYANGLYQWRVEYGEVDEPTEHETWVEAREALVQNIQSRINSLIDDMASGYTTGSEAQSVQALTDALIDVVCHDENDTITASADGIDFRAERVERED
jgi:hypothetical protein